LIPLPFALTRRRNSLLLSRQAATDDCRVHLCWSVGYLASAVSASHLYSACVRAVKRKQQSSQHIVSKSWRTSAKQRWWQREARVR